MPSSHRVLVFPGGTEIGLEINAALRDLKEVELFSAGSDVSNHAPFVFAHHVVVPSVTETGWVEAVNRVIDEHRIDFLYPAHDDVVLASASRRSDLRAIVLAPSIEVCRICRSKSATYQLLRPYLPVPETFSSAARVTRFPVFVKPDVGQGAQGAAIARSAEELEVLLSTSQLMVISEFLPGAEYTVDCFSDREKGLLYCEARRRRRVRMGISVATEPAALAEAEPMARKIAEILPMQGAWFFQLKVAADGRCKILEVAPRIAGAMALGRAGGVNFPLLTLFEALRYPLEIRRRPSRFVLDRALVNRYQSDLRIKHAFVDLDDTLLVRGKVNLPLIRLVFQWLNEGVKVSLVTRHAQNLNDTLRLHRIAHIFDDVVHLKNGEPKSSAIRDVDGAVLIDDSFRERREVEITKGIPTFDNSMIEALQDYRA